ncbi:MAG TPA: dihydrodipicolinate synthase family protein [Thermodesulfobacteriota bacterium]
MPLSVRGVIPPVTTPFKADGSLDYEALGRNLTKWRTTGLAGYLILGSTGEFLTLSADERRTMLEVARAHIPREQIMIAGAGAESTPQAIQYVKEAVRAGADAVMVVNPNYYKPLLTAEALYRHYVAVAEASEVPVFLYNVPQFTGLNMDAALVSRLAAHPNIVGIKDSSGNIPQLAEIIRNAPADFLVFPGSAQVVLPALALGAAGAILQISCFVPELCVRLVKEWDAGNIEAARKTNNLLLAMHEAIGKYGVPASKAAMDLRGYYGGPARPPLLPPSPEQVAGFRAALEAAGQL